MNEYGEVVEGAVRFQRRLPGPIERVWAHLTDSELRGTWLASGPLEQREGGEVTLHFRHADLTPHAETPPDKYKSMGEVFTSVGRVTRCEPPRVLAFTWFGDSEVIFELTPQGDEVLLTLTHRRLATRDDMIEVSSGWHAHLGVLEERLRGDVPRPFWPRIERFERDYAERFR